VHQDARVLRDRDVHRLRDRDTTRIDEAGQAEQRTPEIRRLCGRTALTLRDQAHRPAGEHRVQRGRTAQRDVGPSACEHRDEACRPQRVGEARLGHEQQAFAADALALPARRRDARQRRRRAAQARLVVRPRLAKASAVQPQQRALAEQVGALRLAQQAPFDDILGLGEAPGLAQRDGGAQVQLRVVRREPQRATVAAQRLLVLPELPPQVAEIAPRRGIVGPEPQRTLVADQRRVGAPGAAQRGAQVHPARRVRGVALQVALVQNDRTVGVSGAVTGDRGRPRRLHRGNGDVPRGLRLQCLFHG